MERLTLESERNDPLVVVEVQGDLNLKGHDDLEVSVKTGSPEECVLEQTDEGIRLVCPDDCKVVVPRDARLKIVKINGDAGIKAVEGEIEVGEANGTLRLRSVGAINIQTVNGNLEGKNIMGDMEVQNVKGNLVIRDVQGDFSASEVGGNLVLDDVDGGVSAKAKHF